MNTFTKMLELKKSGLSAAKIAAELNQQKIKTPMGRKWTPSNVYNQLAKSNTHSTTHTAPSNSTVIETQDFLEVLVSTPTLTNRKKTALIRAYFSA